MKTPITPGEILLEDYLEPMGIWSPGQPISAALRYQLVAAATYLRSNLGELRFGELTGRRGAKSRKVKRRPGWRVTGRRSPEEKRTGVQSSAICFRICCGALRGSNERHGLVQPDQALPRREPIEFGVSVEVARLGATHHLKIGVRAGERAVFAFRHFSAKIRYRSGPSVLADRWPA